MPTIRVGCAGWNIAKQHAALFQIDGSHLARYASTFDSVEINSSFYRPHRPATYQRWAASVPAHFWFSVKAPKAITHERKLVDTSELLSTFVNEVENLGTKLGPLLLQLPPSLQFDRAIAESFFGLLRGQFSTAAVCEPRHQSWFTQEASSLLKSYRIGRVIADPPVVSNADPTMWSETIYYRLHGSPRMYYSSYSHDYLDLLAENLLSHSDTKTVWCIFDNTAEGHAIENANYLLQQLPKR